MTADFAEGFVAERRRLLEEGDALLGVLRDHEEGVGGPAHDAARRRLQGLRQRYRSTLPEVATARCPVTGELVLFPMDVADLDGWFWNLDAPVRRHPDRLPATWLAMTGAMRVVEPVKSVPFHRFPGPGLPYVVPRLLERPGVSAVVRELALGPHHGWAITYFGPRPAGVPLVNEWGTHTYQDYDDNGAWLGWGSHVDSASEQDFDLRPWLESGKVFWTALTDSALRLHTGAEGCPFADPHEPPTVGAILAGDTARYRPGTKSK
ncbi:hypothetical protein ACWIGI_10705 [Nocardia sp. NPDC055321]